MKKSILFILTAVAVILSSCSKTDVEKSIDNKDAVLYGDDILVAEAESPVMTRTQLGSDFKSVVWSAGDSFALVSSDGKIAKFTLSSGAGTSTGTFSGTVTGNAPYYAVYPYSENVRLDGGNLVFSLEKEQKGPAGNIAPGVSPSVAKITSADEKLYFRNTGSILRLALCGSGTISSIAIHDLMGNNLWGTYSVNLDGAEPETEVTEGDNTILFEPANPITLQSGSPSYIYVAVPAGSFGHGFSVVLYEKNPAPEWEKDYGSQITSAYSFLQSTSKYNLKRSAILSMPNVNVVKNAETYKEVARGYYKDLFMDGGIHLTSRTSLPAAAKLGWEMEYFASNAHGSGDDDEGKPNPGKLTAQDTLIQRQLIQGYSDDENGILLYPDGEPRFRTVYMNGGKSGYHGTSLEETGRQRYRDYMGHGGTYVGTCAGSFLTCMARVSNATKPGTKVNSSFLHIWPGYTAYLTRKYVDELGNPKTETAIKGFRHRATISPKSGINKYFDFGGDGMISTIRHEGGSYMVDNDIYPAPVGTEIVLQYYFPPAEQGKGADKGDTTLMNNKVCTWSFKGDDASGRIVACGSHPEGFHDTDPSDKSYYNPETLNLMESFLLYASDNPGDITTKGTLNPGEPRRMDKKTSDNDPDHTGIGDRQYHHFKIDVPDSDNGVKISLVSDKPDMDLYLALRKGDYAWISDAEYVLCNKGGNKTFCTRKLEPGIWYVSVMCATTVTSTRTKYTPEAYWYKYSGNTAVLNGVPYTITYSLINPDGTDSADGTGTQGYEYQSGGSWEQ